MAKEVSKGLGLSLVWALCLTLTWGCGSSSPADDGDNSNNQVDPSDSSTPDGTEDDTGEGQISGACDGDPSTGDSDLDGVCNNIDICPDANPDDSDGDSICDNLDLCQGDNETGDPDLDGLCSDVDPCPGSPDNEGTCKQLCEGTESSGDTDGDGICNAEDTCPNDNPDDLNFNGVCDSEDVIEFGVTGDSCAAPIILKHYTIYNEIDLTGGAWSGDFDDDWTDQLNFENTGCAFGAPKDLQWESIWEQTGEQVYRWDEEFVLEAHLKAGQTIKAVMGFGVGWAARIMDTCGDDASASCSHMNQIIDREPYFTTDFGWKWADLSEDQRNLEWTAPADGTYYVVVEQDVQTYGWQTSYDFQVSIQDPTESSCDDGFDNDGNGLIDCIDPGCYATCGTQVIVDESFDSSSAGSWQVSTIGNWNWTDAANPTDSPSQGGYMSHLDLPGEGLHFIELDLSAGNVSSYLNSYLVFWHSDPSTSFQSEMKIEVSYDNGTTWHEAMTSMDLRTRFDIKKTGVEVFNVAGLLQGRGTPRLRVGFRKDCPDEPSECGAASEWVRWEIDDIRLMAWTSADDFVPARVDNSINLHNPTDEAHSTAPDPSLPQGDGETCSTAVGLGMTVVDWEAGDDFINRDYVAQQQCQPQTEAYDDDHDWSQIESCKFVNVHDWEYTPTGPEKVWAAKMKAGDRLWAHSHVGIDGMFMVVEDICDPEQGATECEDKFDSEQYGLYEFVAPRDGTYYLVFKTEPQDNCHQPWNTNHRVDFELDVGHFKPTESHCSDGIDNDGDGQADCDDPNCFEREECNRTVLFSELFSSGLPADFQSSGFSEDKWEWCAGVEEGSCTYAHMWGSDINTFSDSAGGYAILINRQYGGFTTLGTPPIAIGGHGKDHLALNFSAKYAAMNQTFYMQVGLYVEVLVDGEVKIGRGMPHEVSLDTFARGITSIDLSAYKDAENIQIRFVLDNLGDLHSQPWRIDDLMVVGW